MAVKRITKRWLLNSFGVIFSILVIMVVGFSIAIRSYYYSSVRQIMDSRALTILTLLEKSAQDSSIDFSTEVRRTVENFADKDKMELMALDSEGKIIITSSGFSAEDGAPIPDFDQAVRMGYGTGRYQGQLGGENIMAASWLSPISNTELAAVRIVVSLTAVDQQIILLIAIVTLVAISILLFVIMSSSYFINSIVIPVGDVGDTARKIAQGQFDARLTKKNDDEIGDLCDTINYMAEELSANEKLKNDFISSVSHELRTPLTAIKGWGETLASDDTPDRETLKKGMHVIISETHRLSGMVEDLLDFSRIQSGRLSMHFSKFDLLAELGEAVIMFTERARIENIALIYDEPDFLAAVMGDKNRLRQVFVNILDNALKYSDSGDTITVSAKMKQGNIMISIADTGSGISDKDLPHVKNKFYKGDSTRRGSGIGLAVADEIVRMHGGSLDISSKKGAGTTVIIALPMAHSKNSGAPASPSI